VRSQRDRYGRRSRLAGHFHDTHNFEVRGGEPAVSQLRPSRPIAHAAPRPWAWSKGVSEPDDCERSGSDREGYPISFR
jgi:hypothetical protein